MAVQRMELIALVVRHKSGHSKFLLFLSHLPLYFLEECVSYVVHVINMLRTPILSHQTPFKKLYEKIPSYSHRRVFECLANVTNVHVPHKFATHATRYVFIGYPIGQKACKLYDIESNKFFTSSDVIFHENIFPYESISSSPPKTDFVIPIVVFDSSLIQPTHAESNPDTPVSPTTPLCRSQRTRVPPIALSDYVCNQVRSQCYNYTLTVYA